MLHRSFAFPARSLRGRLTLLVAAVVLPALVFAAGLSWQTYRRERASLMQQTEGTARALRLVLEGFLREKEALLRGLVVSRNLETGRLEDFYAQAKEALPGPDEWIVLIGPDGQQVLNTHLPWGSPLPKVRFRADFRAAAEAGETYVSRLTRGPASNQWVVFLAIPLRDEQGLRYTVNLAMRPAVVARALLHPGIGDGWTVSVVDRDAHIIARNRSGETFVGRQASGSMLEAIQSRWEGSLESRTLDGIPTISAFSRSSRGWGVIIGAPREEMYAPAQHTLAMVLAAAVVLAILTSAMAWWVSGGVVRGVRSLVDDAGGLARAEPLGPVHTGMDDTDLVATALRDTAEKLRAREHELRQLNETLESRVQERTKALAEANRDLEEFARIASHDLKEPLRLITSFANLLRVEHGDALKEVPRNYVERIEAAAARMTALVRDILTYSRASALPTQQVAVDLNATLRDVRADLQMPLRESGGRVEAEKLASVRGDPVQMHQLLGNLVGNAVKFRRAGVAPVVRVSTEVEDGLVRLVVEDNGTGFDQQYAERIFAPFERLHSYSRYEGTGIGLAIVRRVAERHGGWARARSVPGEGSRFEVTLPAIVNGGTPRALQGVNT